MSVFICDSCSALENSAVGHYHCRNSKDHVMPEYLGKALCSECATEDVFTFKDRTFQRTTPGKWHNHFPKEIMTEERVKEIGPENFVYLGRFEYLKK